MKPSPVKDDVLPAATSAKATAKAGVIALQGANAVTVAIYDQRILRALRRITRCVEQYSRQLVADCQITAPQLICLMEIANHGPLIATVISRAVNLSPSTVVGIIDRLEDKGWVTRVRGIEDRRVIYVSATAAGKKLLEQAPSPLQKTLSNALKDLSELEQATIALSLERVVALMQAQGIDAAPILASGPIHTPVT